MEVTRRSLLAVCGTLEGIAMSRSNPARFVLSVAAEVAAVVFIVSVLPRVDLRTSAGAAPTFSGSSHANEAPSLLPPIASWPTTAESRREAPTYETSYYQRRTQPAASPQSGRDLPPREPTPLIAVDPARPEYVEQRLDRSSQDLVNTVGSYVSQAASDLLQAPSPQPTSPPRTISPPAYRSPSGTANSPSSPPTGSFSTAPALPNAFPTQPQPQPRPWVRY